MPLVPATQSQFIRSSQKDEHCQIFLRNSANQAFQTVAANICYVSVVRLSSDDGTVRTSYRLLGALSLLQLVITVCLQLNNFRQGQNARQDLKHRNFSINLTSKTSPQDTQAMDPRAARCILCLEERINSTCTPCGHLFCWDCITQWCNNKAECPLCRDKFQPQRLVFLQNFN
ncbi:peroxisome biogenesis factor 10 [Thalassophryne amazonica]|uniref:peroxisome biogenesis factor 10 n=1 Tax=Thalassophryne amazonica TaxID=390379 RepID=UPI001471249C|nr:peroxisome biogenesis factor 10 [Thalassophryne amazonica]